MTDELARLAVEVEGATGPSEDLDLDITNAVFGEIPHQCAAGWAAPEFTASLDAVVALIRERLPGCGYTLEYRPQYGDWAASVRSQGRCYIVPAATGALALLAATLRALAAQEQADA